MVDNKYEVGKLYTNGFDVWTIVSVHKDAAKYVLLPTQTRPFAGSRSPQATYLNYTDVVKVLPNYQLTDGMQCLDCGAFCRQQCYKK